MSDTLQSVVASELQTIIDCLTDAFPSCRVMEEYEYRQAAALSVASLTVGVRAIRSHPLWLDNVGGYDAVTGVCYCAPYEIDYEVTVHCPLAENGSYGRWLQTRVADVILASSALGFASVTAGAITYDRPRHCLCLPLTLTGRYVL